MARVRTFATLVALLLLVSAVPVSSDSTLKDADVGLVGKAKGLVLAGGNSRAGSDLPPTSTYHRYSLAFALDLISPPADGVDRFHSAIVLAKHVTRHHADLVGSVGPTSRLANELVAPSAGLEELASRMDLPLTPEQSQAVLVLDDTPEPLRTAIARFVGAFLVLEAAAQLNLDPTQLARHESQVLGFIGAYPSRDNGMRWSTAPNHESQPVLVARLQFLTAIAELHDAAAGAIESAQFNCNSIDVPPAFSFDLGGCDSTYVFPYALQLDLGGNDRYYNNAGGSNIYGGFSCGLPLPGGRAALVDFGGGSDTYGNPSEPRRCGVNGGGSMGGMGFLLDDGGDDFYLAQMIGTNGGGANAGTGFLLDVDGADTYQTLSGGGVNGGGWQGIGSLIDTGGNDIYSSGGSGANGGGQGSFAQTTGLGTLVDTEGADVYFTTTAGGNGGGIDDGIGFLFDKEGNDVYVGWDLGTNGGGYYGGEGFLFDASGQDHYSGGSYGTNGGGSMLGRGLLVDLQGDDAYVAGGFGNNGGVGPGDYGSLEVAYAGGLLVDRSGTDSYQDSVVSCRDCTVVPKGTFGFQLDLGNPPP